MAVWKRLPLMAIVLLSLLAGIWAGLVRLGWQLPPLQPASHGPLMVSGFLGTLISLERAVALNRGWAYLAPILGGAGALLLLLGAPNAFGPAALTLCSFGLVILFAYVVRRHPVRYTALMGAGAVAWFVGNLLWLFGWPIYRIVYWWAAFLVLTIVGERLELSRVLRLTDRSQRLLTVAAGLLISGLLLELAAHGAGTRLFGLGLLALTLWLGRYDIARRTVRRPGLTRYIAICLLSGYVWLAISGGLLLSVGGIAAGPLYDAVLHSLFLGFVFAMIFGHAPIILPSVLNIPLPFHRFFYAPLLLLHLSLLLRLVGDLFFWHSGRLWGGMLNGITLLFFFATVLWSTRRARATQKNRASLHSEITEKPT